MSNEIKYGWVYGGKRGVELPVAADQYFHRLGGHFCYLDSAGNVTICASGTAVFGWAETPKDASGYNSWKSSSTAKTDRVFVITDPTAVYICPGSTAASCLATIVGNSADIRATSNSGVAGAGGSSYTTKQTIGLTTASDNCLRIIDFNTDLGVVYVMIDTAQKDT